jgi:hypothetical protein
MSGERGREKAEREYYRREQLRRKRGGRRKDVPISVSPTNETSGDKQNDTVADGR